MVLVSLHTHAMYRVGKYESPFQFTAMDYAPWQPAKVKLKKVSWHEEQVLLVGSTLFLQ